MTPTEIVDILDDGSVKKTYWKPKVGSETHRLMENFNIPDFEKNRIRDEAVKVLSKCISPLEPAGKLTGLVIGYVQSGKTMSFTTVTALARDNGYRLIIVIAGTSIPLLTQSTNRLKKDLQIDERDDRQWQHYESRTIKLTDYTKIKNSLADWCDNSVPLHERKTILLTVMKHHGHLQKVYDILERLDLSNVPTLIIDDEADQASLNAKVNKGETSTTYQKILSLKDIIPHHTFLQYTATPQAPLLINLIDILSPRFAEVLTPGSNYIGGKQFFIDAPQLIKIIPDNEIPSKEVVYSPPDSLIEAMQLFFLGVASGLVIDGGKGNRSMLVHPSHKTISHIDYYRWIEKTKTRWQQLLDLNDTDPDKQNLVNEFKKVYSDLKNTVQELPPFDDLRVRLPHAIRRTHLEEVNARKGKTPNINWQNAYSHVLVGGQAMDRGFTVEGLTVTYMPRGAGTGNVDTIQQRARFFGYKRNYQDYCRIFLENRVYDAYRDSIKHEENIRDQMIELSDNGKPLSEWKRAFFLDRKLRPTRKSVIDLDYMRGNISNNWFSPKAPHDSQSASIQNHQIILAFLKKYAFVDDDGDPHRTPEQVHKIFDDILLKDAYEELLVRLRITRLNDSQRFTGILLQIKNYIDIYQSAETVVYLMSGGNPRKRTANDRDEIPNLFQGRNPLSGKVIYPGDRKIFNPYKLTIQIHILNVESNDGSKEYLGIPAVAIRIPKEISVDWVVQNQGGN